MRPQSRYQHVFWFALLLATAATLAGASIAVGAYEGARDPASVVRAYFAALSDDDAAGALGYGDVVPPGRHDLLTSDVLAAQNAIAPIDDLTVLDVRNNSGTSAVVDVTYRLDFGSGTVTVPDSIAMVHDHGHWQLALAAVPLTVHPGDGSAFASLAGPCRSRTRRRCWNRPRIPRSCGSGVSASSR